MNNKLLTLAVAAAALALPTVAKAYTVQQIIDNGKYMLAEYTYANYYGISFSYDIRPYHRASEIVTLEADGDTHILVKGLNNVLAFRFTLADAAGKETTDGTCLQMESQTASVGDIRLERSAQWGIYPVIWSGNKFSLTDAQTIFELVENKGDGKIHFAEHLYWGYELGETGIYFRNTTGSIDLTGICGFVIDSFDFYPVDCNAVINTTKKEYIPSIETINNSSYELIGTAHGDVKDAHIYKIDTQHVEYPAVVNFGADNTFDIINLNGYGYGIEKKTSSYNGYEEIMGEYTTIKGKIDPVNGTAIINAEQVGRIEIDYQLKWDWYDYVQDYIPYYYTLTPFTDINGSPAEEIVGTYTADEPVHHNNEEHGWVTNRGRRRTLEGAYMTFPAMTYTCIGTTFPYAHNWLDTFHDTQIHVGPDVTLDVELNLERVHYNEQDGVYMVGSITTNKNDQYVDHYDVMLVKGKWEHIEESGFQPCVDNGHKEAKVLCDHRSDAFNNWNSTARLAISDEDYQGENIGEHDYSFAKLISPEDLGHNPTDGEYTAFIRAVYKPETGLTPTFHSMQYVADPIMTSVDGLHTDLDNAVISTAVGIITVSGTDAEVNICNLAGQSVYCGKAGSVSVQPGIYIVHAGTRTAKVVVR